MNRLRLPVSSLFLAVVLAGTFQACQPQEDPAPPPPPVPVPVSNLTGGDVRTWKISRYIVGTDTVTVTSNDCNADNRLAFYYDDSRFVLTNGTQKCDTTEPSSLKGTWAFGNSNAYLELRDTAGHFVERYEVQDITGSEITVTYPVVIPNRGSFERKETWVVVP